MPDPTTQNNATTPTQALSQSALLAKHGYEKFAVATDGGTTIYRKGNFAVWLTLDGRILDSSPHDQTATEIHLANAEVSHGASRCDH